MNTWTRHPIKALEHLAASEPAQRPLPAQPPTLGRPILSAHLGLLDETVLGAYGSATRRRHETELVAALLQQLEPHVAAAAPRRQNQEATPLSQWDMMFHMADAATAARQGLRDEGGVQIALSGLSAPVWVVLREGPGRLPSVFVRVVVSNLPGDFMVPGAVACLLESAGYALGGDDGVVVRAEHGGEQRAAIAAFAPGVARLGVVVGIVKPPPSDPTLARLPRRLQDVDGLITINVAGLRPSQPASTGIASAPARQPYQPAAPRAALPGFIRAAHGHHPMAMPAGGQRLSTALDPIIHLGAHIPGDRRGLGRYPSPPPGPVPPHARDVQPMESDRPESPLAAQPQPPAPPAAMDVDPPPVPLQDVPLVDPLLQWLADEDPNSLPHAQLRLQVLAIRDQYPSLWQRYAQDASYPPHPEVRSAAAASVLQSAPEPALPAQQAAQPAPALLAQHQPTAGQPEPAALPVEQGATGASVRVPSESGGNAGRHQGLGRGGLRSVAQPRDPRSPPPCSSPSSPTVADRQGGPVRDSGYSEGTGRGDTSAGTPRGRGRGAAGRGSGRTLVRPGALGPIAPPPPSPITASPSQQARSAPLEGPASAARRRHQSQDHSVSQHAWHHPARLPTSQSLPPPPGSTGRATK